MLKRILPIWFTANFVFVGIAALFLRRWYLDLPPLGAMSVELGLIMTPNLLIPILVLRATPSVPTVDPRAALGWRWSGVRALLSGVAGFVVICGANWVIERLAGPSIPYELPGTTGPISVTGAVQAVGLLLLLLVFVVLTVAGEETMFRGFIQGQVTAVHGPWLGMALAGLLFGLRHLPADLFYAGAWSASARMWVSRELQLYIAALVLGAARYVGRSTYASAIVHLLILLSALFG
jgi:membrane protease YdiL (CAAX protease family)